MDIDKQYYVDASGYGGFYNSSLGGSVGGGWINLNHDNFGRISSLVNDADSSNYLSAVTYNAAQQVTGRTLGSNIVETFDYNNRFQMTGQTAVQNGSTRMD